ncbi:methyltransferase family protein [Chloroflexota bacterium]
MSLADKWAEIIYRMAMDKSKLKTMMTPVTIILWFGLSVLFVLASLWLDELLPLRLSLSPPANILLSLLPLIIGATLILPTIYSFIRASGSPVPFNPPKNLITTGFNSQIRNPMLLGWIIMLFGVGILLNSISVIFIFAPLFICLNYVYLKTIEEKEMEKKFGEAYVKYKESVPMFIPRFKKRK